MKISAKTVVAAKQLKKKLNKIDTQRKKRKFIICTNCGNETTEGQIYCENCHAKVVVRICKNCKTPIKKDAKYCGGCGILLANTKTSRKNTKIKQYADNKRPALALFLSLFIVGLGQFYNGDFKKGGLMLGGALIVGMASYGIIWFLVAIWSAIDAYRVASRKTPLWK